MAKRNPLEAFLLGASELAPGIGTAAGTGIGAALGMAGGPLAPLTVPVAAALGGTIGGTVGGAGKLAGDLYEQGQMNAAQDELAAKQAREARAQEDELRKLAREQAAMDLLNQFL